MFWTKILALDEKLTTSLRIHEHQKWMRPFGIFFAHSGDSWFILLLLVLVWFFTKGFWHRLSALLAGAVVMLAIIVLVIKFLIKRRRPEGTWGAIYRNSDPHSFPSGHAARTMMLAALMLLLVLYGWGLYSSSGHYWSAWRESVWVFITFRILQLAFYWESFLHLVFPHWSPGLLPHFPIVF